MAVPLLDLEAQYRPLRDQLIAAMTRVADPESMIMAVLLAARLADAKVRS